MPIANIENLKQLHNLDETVSISPEHGQSIHEAFVKGFEKIKTRQLAEIEHLRKRAGSEIFDNSPRISKLLKDNNQVLKLNDIIVMDAELNTVNITLIKPIVKEQKKASSTVLDLSYMGITRFPKEVIDNLAKESFWRNLRYLKLNGNLLQTLPSNIGTLQALQELHIEGNQISVLPEGLYNLAGLRVLLLGGNQLTEISETINKLANLQKLNVCFNQLREIPSSIEALAGLKELIADHNQLTTLPETILSLPRLKYLIISDNRFTSISSTIVERFGEDWYRRQLSSVDVASNVIRNTFNQFTPFFANAMNYFVHKDEATSDLIDDVPTVDAAINEENSHKRKSDDERGSSKRLKV